MAYSSLQNNPNVKYQNGQYFYKDKFIYNPYAGGATSDEGLKKRMAEIDEEGARTETKDLTTNLAKKSGEMAEQFRADVPKYTGLLQDSAKKTIQRNLAEKIGGLRQQSSNRGFLGGSGTQTEQADALALSQVETQDKESDISDALEKQAKTYENQALANKMELQGSANQAVLDQLRQNILDTQRQSELWKQLGQIAGTGAGYYVGSKT